MTTEAVDQATTAPTPRDLWLRYESVHAVTYFAPEVAASLSDVGLRGFWMGYFAARAAPFGPVSAPVVEASFFGFAADRVARALPDAWAFAPPERVLAARLTGIDRALRRLAPAAVGSAVTEEAADLARRALSGCRVGGRALYGAHTAMAWPDEPHLALWWATTLLREHRGDGHVAANLANGFDGLTATVAHAAAGAVSRDLMLRARGWTDEAWDAAVASLTDAGLIASDGMLTPDGVAARAAVEAATDRLAAEPWDHLGPAGTVRLHELLGPVANTVADGGDITFPNPIGLPDPRRGDASS